MSVLITIVLLIAIFHLLGKFLFRTLIRLIYLQSKRKYPHQRTEGSIHVDYNPNEKKKTKQFKGGEYVDYEEID